MSNLDSFEDYSQVRKSEIKQEDKKITENDILNFEDDVKKPITYKTTNYDKVKKDKEDKEKADKEDKAKKDKEKKDKENKEKADKEDKEKKEKEDKEKADKEIADKKAKKDKEDKIKADKEAKKIADKKAKKIAEIKAKKDKEDKKIADKKSKKDKKEKEKAKKIADKKAKEEKKLQEILAIEAKKLQEIKNKAIRAEKEEIEKEEKLERKEKKNNFEDVPELDEYESSKIFFNTEFLTAYLLNDMEYFTKEKNFQKEYTRKLPKLLWTFEKDYNLGDMCMLFPNPDYNKFIPPKEKNKEEEVKKQKEMKENNRKNFITSKEAKEIFSSITENSFNYPLKKNFLKKLRVAFLNVFVKLENFEFGNEHKNKMEQEKRDKNLFKKDEKKFKTQFRDNSDDTDEDVDEQQKKNEKIDPTNYNTNTTPVQNKEKQLLLDVSMENINKLQVKNNIKNEIKEILADRKKEKKKQNKKMSKKDKEIEEEVKNMIKKQVVYGDFFDYSEESQWKRTLNQTTDFLTLIRQTIYVILSFQGVVVREFISQDGLFIIAVCYAHKENIMKIGQSLTIKKRIDISMSDIFSLEPVDERFRPLRLNEVLFDDEKWKNQNFPNEYQKKLKKDIKKLLKNLALHQKIRKFNSLNDEVYHSQKKISDEIIKHAKIDLKTWLDYKIYLTDLTTRVNHIDDQFEKKLEKLKKEFLSSKKENSYRITKKHLTGNKSTYRILSLKLRKNLGNAYAVN